MNKLLYLSLLCCFALFSGVQAKTSATVKNEKVFILDESAPGNKENAIIVSPDCKYGVSGNSYGYEFKTAPATGKPYFFSVDLPEGNFNVKVLLGGKKNSCTTIKAESRRLMVESVTTKAGEYATVEFAVNLRNKYIGKSDSVRLKVREFTKLNWDNKLTLEFNGVNPSVARIEITPATDLITVFLAGNSTVVDQDEEPWCGWGQMLPRFFTNRVAIANYAESGEAANSFVSAKRLAKLLTVMKKGDYLFIEFGHNDEKQKGEGVGPYTTYKKNMKVLVDETRKKGGIPVLVTSMHRRSFDENGKVINTHGDFPDAVRLLAKEEKVALIDLTNMSAILYEAWGPEKSKLAFVHYPAGTYPNQDKPLADNTHFNSYGGYQIMHCILKGISDLKLPLCQYLRNDYRMFDPAHPDDFNSFSMPATPFSSFVKPDGN